LDKLSDFTFKNLEVTTKNPVLKNKYDDVKFDNVLVNGEPLVVKK